MGGEAVLEGRDDLLVVEKAGEGHVENKNYQKLQQIIQRVLLDAKQQINND